MRLITMLVLVGAVAGSAGAQVAGDYQTAGSGPWNAPATWSVYSGTAWIPATMAPSGAGTITVQAADSVDVNVPVTITGTLRSLGGKFGFTTGALTIANTGVYEHAANGASIPLASWDPGSTCLVTGVINSAPSNANQPFHNFTWDCAGYTSAVNLAWLNLTIGGDLKVIRSGNKIDLRLTNSGVTAPDVNTITITGNVIVDDTSGSLTATGSSGTDTILVHVNGGITSKGTIKLANGSGATCNWVVKGDIVLLSGAFNTNSTVTRPDSLIFIGKDPQLFAKAGSLTSLANVRFCVRSGAVVDFDTNNVGVSSGSHFTLEPGGTMICGHPNGLAGTLRNGGPTTLSTEGNYVFDGAVAQTDTLMPAVVNDLAINNAAGVAFDSALTVNGALNLMAGMLYTGTETVTIAPAGTVTRGSGYVVSPMAKTLAAGQSLFEVGAGGSYAPVGVNVTGGSGPMTVLAVAGSHPNSFDVNTTLARYWTLTAGAGITQADLTFTYPAGDVKGDESKYRAWRYTGSGTAWNVAAGSVNLGGHTVTASGVTVFSDWTCGESGATAMEAPAAPEIPSVFFVDQNFPNPFNPSTTITYGLPRVSYVTAALYNLLGQKVMSLYAGVQPAGVHSLRVDGSGLGSGVYMYRIEAGTSVATKRMVLLR